MKFRKIAFALFLSILSFIGYTQINVYTNFNINSPQAIDTRMVVVDTNARNGITWKYEGLLVYVLSDQTNYQLRGGTTNDKWVTISTSAYTAGTGLTLTGNTFSHDPHTGDVTGATSLTIVAIQGRSLATTTPTSGDVLSWNGSAWAPSPAFSNYTTGTGITLSGNTFSADNTSAIWNANQLMGSAISTTVPINNQVLKWNGTDWAPSMDSNTFYAAGTGITLSANTFSADNATPIWNAGQIMGFAVATTSPFPDQVLKWTGTEWSPARDSNTFYAAGTGITLSSNTFSADNTSPIWNANQIMGMTISTTGPIGNQILKWNGTEWTPTDEVAYDADAGSGIILSANTFFADNNAPLWNARMIWGNDISTNAPASNEVLTWNGSVWIPAPPTLNYYDAGTGLTLTSNTFAAQNNTAMWNADQLQGSTVSAAVPSNNQILKYSGGSWIPSNEVVYDAGTGISLTGSSFSHIAHTGDVIGTTSLTVTALRGRTITTSVPTIGNILKWNGSLWAMGSGIDTFNGNKSVTRTGWTGVSGVNMTTNTTVSDFLNAVFFPFISATISINTTALYEVGTSTTVTITGATTPNNETIFSNGRVDRVYPGATVTIYSFGAALSYSTTITFTPNQSTTSTLELRYVAYQGVGGNGTPGIINSTVKAVKSYYPYLHGVTTVNLTSGGTAAYTSLTKVVEVQANKTKNFTGTGYLYFCYPASYGTLTSILDPSSFQILTGFTRYSVNVTSSGLVNNWSEPYYIYQSNTISTPSGSFQFFY
jgi:hypothetical protein